MIATIRSWWRRWRAAERAIASEARARQRAIDAELLFPALWANCGGRLELFARAATTHTSADPAWRYLTEWIDTDHNPGRWAARRMARESAESSGGDADRATLRTDGTTPEATGGQEGR